ncbi:hypothetical protein ABIA06_006718 [Bradyrhizobium yuanmingense]|uniref:hypothetical protein n=1 Tax=Bradyrhizobium yuanmingense TaxID=108015 RepID=UPI0035172470
MSRIANIADARILKARGLPLDLPIEEATFSLEYSRHWFRLMEAHSTFMNAINEYAAGPRAGSPGKWKLAKRRLAGLDGAMGECLCFASKLGGGSDPPVFESEQDRHEHDLLLFFLLKRAAPFVQFWSRAIEAADAGAELLIRPSDVPLWFDKD